MSIFYGAPAKLPGVALGLPFLLDLERAAAVLAAMAAVLVFAVLTSRGFLPTSIGNVVGYEGDRQHALERQVEQLDRRNETRVERLEDHVRGADDLLAVMGQELLDLRTLTELVETPPGAPPRRAYVDVILAAPNEEWAESIAVHLRKVLPDAQVKLGPSGLGLRDAPPPGYVVRCEISWPGQLPQRAKEAVRGVFSEMEDVDADYSEPIDLIVVTPRDGLSEPPVR